MASRPLTIRLSNSSNVCPGCSNAARGFSTSSARRRIQPESPRFITYPEPPQQTKKSEPRIKGTLPQPRVINLHRQLPKQASSKRSPESTDPRLLFNERMSALRKQNITTGLQELTIRRQQDETDQFSLTGERARARRAVSTASQRRADMLTEQTLDISVRAELARLQAGAQIPDPDRAKRLAKARRSVAELEKRRAARRADALHTLYMNARTFIVDAEGLEKAIDEAFGTVQQPKVFDGPYPSLWNNPPPTMQDLVASLAGTGQGMAKGALTGDRALGEAAVLRERVKRMAEGVTGGRMDS